MQINLASLRGLTYTLPDLYKQFAVHGWEVKKVKYDSQTDRIVATAKAPHGEEIESWGPTPERAVSNLLFNVVHRNHMRSSKVASWTYTFTDQLIPIAEAYAKASIYEPKAATSFMELARDSVNRAKAIQEQLTVQFVNEPEPYKSPDKMYDDIRKRRRLIVSRIGATHPLWSLEEVLAYRVVHDVLGYAVVNAQWDWEGENQAFAAHASVVSTDAQPALFTESIGQTAYATYYRSYGPQKVALFPQFMDKAMETENPHSGFRGIHPSQMFLPGKPREAKPPHEARIQRLANGQLPVDINAGWQSNQPVIAPYDQTLDDSALGLNEMEHMISGNGLNESDPNHIKGLHTDWTHEGPGGANTGWNAPMRMDEAQTRQEWQGFAQENPQGANMIRQAVSNALRAACMSPRTLLHQNAQQYQDLASVPFDESDPNAHWDTLERSRQDWNAARFGDQHREDHRPWNLRATNPDGSLGTAPIISLAAAIYDHDRSIGQAGAKREAQQMINREKTRFQQFLSQKQSKLPADEEGWIIDNKANKMVLQWIRAFTDESAGAHDEYQPSADETAAEIMHMAAADEQIAFPGLEPEINWPQGVTRSQPLALDDPKRLVHRDYGDEYKGYENHKINNLQRYGAFLGTGVQTIAQLTRHLDDIVVAALEDVHAHDGSGHHFRMYMMSLNVPGVGSKIISFAWLLLQPLTSQLATIDSHMAHILGYPLKDNQEAPPTRDYYRLERELGARRDALGLNHVPLGQFQWATWDMGRTGAGAAHQDHSFLRPVDPTPAWKVKVLPRPDDSHDAFFNSDLMRRTQPAADRVIQDWKANEERQFPAAGSVPTRADWPIAPDQQPQHLSPAMARVASTPMPPEPGTAPIPEGNVRLWHYTGADPDQVRQQGLLMQHAKGMQYGEPNQIWASASPPSFDNHNVVEFSMHPNDPRWDIGRYTPGTNYGEGGYSQYLHNHGSHVTFNGDIKPEEILAVHEPWHQHYRYLMDAYPHPDSQRLAEMGGPSAFDWAIDPSKGGGPDLARGVQAWKDTLWPEGHLGARIASTPWVTHPETGERIQGSDGQTIMQLLRSLGLNVDNAWNTIDDEAAGKQSFTRLALDISNPGEANWNDQPTFNEDFYHNHPQIDSTHGHPVIQNMGDDERIALEHYQGAPDANQILRHGHPRAIDEPQYDDFVDAMDSALAQHPPLQAPTRLYRCTSYGNISNSLGSNNPSDWIGKEVPDHGYMSTTVNPELFQALHKERPQLRISAPEGTPGAYLPDHGYGEQEWVLPRGAQLRFTGYDPDAKLLDAELRGFDPQHGTENWHNYWGQSPQIDEQSYDPYS